MKQHKFGFRGKPLKSKKRDYASTSRFLPQKAKKLALEWLENREVPATLQFSNSTYVVSENVGMATVTVLRTGGSAGTVTVDYATSNGSAAAGSDYTATSGKLTFADGQSSTTFDVPIIDDTVEEGDEGFNLSLSNPTGGATLGSPNTAVLTIQASDSPAVGAHTLAYIHWPGGPGGSLATSPINTQTSGSTVLSWVGRGKINQFTSGNAPTDNKGNTGTMLGTVHDYGPQYAESGFALYNFPSFAGGDGNVFSAPTPESDEITFIVVEVKNGGLIQDYKYNRVDSGTKTTLSVTTTGPATLVSFWTGISGAQGTVNAVPNNGFTVLESQVFTYDAVQAFVAAKEVATAGTYDVTWTATPDQPSLMYLVAVQRNPSPQPGTLQLSASSYTVNEDQGTATITVARTGGSTGAVAINYATSDGTAIAGSDYTATSGTLNFADGQTSQTFTVPITDDMLAEGNQTLNVTLTNPTGGATLGTPAAATLTIADNDGPQVQSVEFNGGAPQRSMVKQMVVTFSEMVNFSGAVTDAFTLYRHGSGTPTGNVTLSATPSTGPASSVTITFSGSLTTNGSLNDGFYDFTIAANQVAGIGGTLNGGGGSGTDYSVVGDTTNKFFRLFGDSNGDGVTNLTDFAAFRGAFNLGASSIFDYGEGDDNVGLFDFAQFRIRFNMTP